MSKHLNRVTYDQAVKLKEHGFDWKVTHYYYDNGELSKWYSLINYNYANGYGKIECSAPTVAEALKFYRDEKGVKCSVSFSDIYYGVIFFNKSSIQTETNECYEKIESRVLDLVQLIKFD